MNGEYHKPDRAIIDDPALRNLDREGGAMSEPTGKASVVTTHHSTATEVAPGIWVTARLLRDSSPLSRWRRERRCRRETGHCWHPEGLIDWWCCECSAATDGWPAQRCTHCANQAATVDG